MGFTHVAAALSALALSSICGFAEAAAGFNPSLERRQTGATKYCDSTTSMCFAQFTTPAATNIRFRFAAQESATTSAPYDIFLQVVAPKAQGWAGIAWGGSMTYNPLLVSWANGNSAVTSSRFTQTKSLPAAYAGATYTTLSSSANATHWELNAVCTGCSHWREEPTEPVIALSTTAATLAWAGASRPPTTPSSNTSGFPYHNAKGFFTLNLSDAKVPADVWARFVQSFSRGGTTVPRQTTETTELRTPPFEPSSTSTPVAVSSSSSSEVSVSSIVEVTSAIAPSSSVVSSSVVPSTSEAASGVSSVVTMPPSPGSTAPTSTAVTVVVSPSPSPSSSEAAVSSPVAVSSPSTSEAPVVSTTVATVTSSSTPSSAISPISSSSVPVPDSPISRSSATTATVPVVSTGVTVLPSSSLSRTFVPDTPISSARPPVAGGGSGTLTTIVTRTFQPDTPISTWPIVQPPRVSTTTVRQQPPTTTQQQQQPAFTPPWLGWKGKWGGKKGKWGGKGKWGKGRGGLAIPEDVMGM